MTTTVDTSERTNIIAHPVTVNTGAEVVGVDLKKGLTEDEVGTLRALLLRWKVLFFRSQHLDPRSLVAFGRHFGQVTPGRLYGPGMSDVPEVWELDSSVGAHQGEDQIRQDWHIDFSWALDPPGITILEAIKVPDVGGDTQWLNLETAYAKLSPPLRSFCDNLWAIHRDAIPKERSDLTRSSTQSAGPVPPSSLHPIVRVHPESGERSLFINARFTRHIDGLTDRESRHILALLFEQMTRSEATLRFRWGPGDIAMWDNRSTAHVEPVDYLETGERRILHRVTVAGDVPRGTDGRTSTLLVERPEAADS